MADENINLETPVTVPDSGAEERIKDLSNKVKTTSSERDEAKRLQTEAEVKVTEAQKERDFYSSFADIVTSQPAAKEHKEEILAKVKSGYTVEDATVAVLASLGKYQTPKGEQVNPAGGSAVVSPEIGGTKRVSEMTQAEKREKLVELEKKGDISLG